MVLFAVLFWRLGPGRGPLKVTDPQGVVSVSVPPLILSISGFWSAFWSCQHATTACDRARLCPLRPRRSHASDQGERQDRPAHDALHGQWRHRSVASPSRLAPPGYGTFRRSFRAARCRAPPRHHDRFRRSAVETRSQTQVRGDPAPRGPTPRGAAAAAGSPRCGSLPATASSPPRGPTPRRHRRATASSARHGPSPRAPLPPAASSAERGPAPRASAGSAQPCAAHRGPSPRAPRRHHGRACTSRAGPRAPAAGHGPHGNSARSRGTGSGARPGRLRSIPQNSVFGPTHAIYGTFRRFCRVSGRARRWCGLTESARGCGLVRQGAPERPSETDALAR